MWSIRQIQEFLIRIYGAGILPRYGADGKYGSETKAAIERFQRDAQAKGLYGGRIDGKWGGLSQGAADKWDGGAAPGGGAGGSSLSDRIRNEFPMLAYLLDVPELQPLITQAANERWGLDRFIARLRDTQWWGATTSVAQEWVTLSPAEQTDRARAIQAQMVDWARQNWGADYTRARFGDDPYSTDSWSWHYAWEIASGKRPKELIFSLLTRDGLAAAGTPLQVAEMDRQEELARKAKRPEEIGEELFMVANRDYLIPLSVEQSRKWADDILQGRVSMGAFRDYLRQEASQKFGRYASEISRGVLPRVLAGANVGILVQELGMSEEAVLANPRLWGEIANQMAGAKDTFTASDWLKYARSLPEWKGSIKAKEMASDYTSFIGQTFGKEAAS